MSGRDERGSGTVLTAGAAMVLCSVMAFAVCCIGWFQAVRRAEYVAEAAALAGASAASNGNEPCASAEQAAVHNGARLTDCRVRGEIPDVVVETAVTVPLRPHFPAMPETVQRRASAATM